METNENNGATTDHNKPLKIMLILTGLVIVSVLFLYFYLPQLEKTNPSKVNDPIVKQIKPIDILTESDRELLASIPKLVRESNYCKNGLNLLENKLNLKINIIKSNVRNIEDIRGTSKSDYDSLALKLSEIRKTLELKYEYLLKKSEQKQIIKQKNHLKKIHRKKINKIINPLFQLISIDVWDSKEIVLVGSKQKTQTLYAGDSFMNWRLKTINRAMGCATFTNQKNIKATLCNKDLL